MSEWIKATRSKKSLPPDGVLIAFSLTGNPAKFHVGARLGDELVCKDDFDRDDLWKLKYLCWWILLPPPPERSSSPTVQERK